GCGLCAEHCPVMAVTVNGAIPSIEAKRCIGCGQCAFQCPAGVFTLVPARRNVVLPLLKKAETRLPVRRS
ncbi:MAG TPA: 4Fe-4S binding protein, partial [Spirochaetota bacterium]|nr:4Fe-4S binding protein [Spirochaetota bacterium]